MHRTLNQRVLTSTTWKTPKSPYFTRKKMLYFGSPFEAAVLNSHLNLPSAPHSGQPSSDMCMPLPPLRITSKSPQHCRCPPKSTLVPHIAGDVDLEDLLNDLQRSRWSSQHTNDAGSGLVEPLDRAPSVNISAKPSLRSPEKRYGSTRTNSSKTAKKTPRARVSASAAWNRLGSPDYYFVDEDRVARR